MYKHQIISEKSFDRITGWDKEKDNEKNDFEYNIIINMTY